MVRKKVNLNNIERIKEFVIEAERCTDKVTVYSLDGYIVNGKSIMGVFSLDLSRPVDVEYNDKVDVGFGEYLSSLEK